MPKRSDEIVIRAKYVIDQEGRALLSIVEQIGESFVEVINIMLNCKGHILVTGMGTSYAVAQRFAHLLSCVGTPALSINAGDGLHGGSGAITENDVVYIISKSGNSSEVERFANIARTRGARVIIQTENVEGNVVQYSDVVLEIKSPANVDPFNMIALGSSLVNCVVCDALCSLLLEMRSYSKDSFGLTHPAGEAGLKLKGLNKKYD